MSVLRCLTIVSLVAVCLCAGCGDDTAPTVSKEAPQVPSGSTAGEGFPPAGRPTAQEMAEDGGRIIMGSIGEPSNLISFLSSDASSHEVASQLYVGLLRYNRDLEIEPWAAESYEVLDGGRLLRFKLRKGIRWQDGVELTADDVEFTYKLIIAPTTPTPYAGDFLAVQEFRKTGRYSFEVRYDKPFARSLISWMQDIMPKHLLEGQDVRTTPFARKPVGAGQYMLESWEPGTRLVLRANPDYFEGRPHIDEVVYRIIPDNATMFLELKAGKLDMMGLSPQQYLRQTDGYTWERDWRKYRYLSFGYTYLGYNLKHPFFADARVRRAIAHAIDREGIIKGVLLGQGVPTVGPYKPGTWVYNDRLTAYSYDPALAAEMLREAGWQDTDGDGILDREGRPFAFTILTNQGNDQRIKTATIIQSQLKDVGIRVQIRTVEWAAFIKEFVNTGRFDAVILGWNITQDPDAYDVWHSSKAEPGGLNFVGYRNAEVDAVLEKARRTFDQDERKQYYDRFQEIVHRDQPYCFLYVPYALPVVAARFRGIDPAPAGLMHNFNRWWVPVDQQRSTVQQ